MNRFGYRRISSAFMLSFIFAPESASKARFHFVVLLSHAISANRSESLNFAFFAKSEWAAPLRQGSCKCSHVYSPSFRKHSARGFRHRCPALSETRKTGARLVESKHFRRKRKCFTVREGECSLILVENAPLSARTGPLSQYRY